jgi:short-subunit dehydrogenase
MKNVALITGGSSGIGYELAKQHAKTGNDLILVARNQEKLQAAKEYLEHEFKVTVKTIFADLSDPQAPRSIYDELKNEGIAVEYLINNAGFGAYGKFYERDLERDLAMIAVNIRALTELSRLFLPDMVARGRGKILNVASTAGLVPGPLESVYYASKAYNISLSQAMAYDLAGTGITVTALCPSATHTGFAQVSGLENSRLFQNPAQAEKVAAVGYQAMLKGKLVVIPYRAQGILLRYIIPFLPRKFTLFLSARMMDKVR